MDAVEYIRHDVVCGAPTFSYATGDVLEKYLDEDGKVMPAHLCAEEDAQLTVYYIQMKNEMYFFGSRSRFEVSRATVVTGQDHLQCNQYPALSIYDGVNRMLEDFAIDTYKDNETFQAWYGRLKEGECFVCGDELEGGGIVDESENYPAKICRACCESEFF
eukprot:SAG11_NODE_7251_length_1172_cov_5.457596_1_plen_161_part_00